MPFYAILRAIPFKLFGVFVVPNNDTLKFRQGERPFKLTDIANTTTAEGTQTTTAIKTYVSVGLASAQRGITLNTREASISVDTVQERRTATSTFEGIQVHRDPVAQSFTVGNFEFQNLDLADYKFGDGADGIFVSCIDL